MSGKKFEHVEEAKAMRAQGMKLREIAAHFGRRLSTVGNALRGERLRDRREEERKARKADRPIYGAGPDCGFYEPHKPRQIRAVIDRAAVSDAARAFAAGQISRQQLLERISAR